MQRQTSINLKCFTQSIELWSVPAADRASRDSKQHTDTRGLILAARGLPFFSPRYIYQAWRSGGTTVEVGHSNCSDISHCVSEQLCQSEMLSAEGSWERPAGHRVLLQFNITALLLLAAVARLPRGHEAGWEWIVLVRPCFCGCVDVLLTLN